MQFELPPDKRSLSTEDWLDDLRRAKTTLGKNALTMTRYDAMHGLLSASTIRRRFGSWSKALKAAGIEIAKNAPLLGRDEEYFEARRGDWRRRINCR